MNNVAVVFGLSFGVLGWLIGIGGLTYPFLKMLGREPAPVLPTRSWVRYFRMTEDHKVVGLQYLVGVLRLLLHGRAVGHGHPHRAAQPDEPRLRSWHLHRHSSASTAR